MDNTDKSIELQTISSESQEVKDVHRQGGNSTVGQAAFNMTKTIVGAGVFGLPNAFQNTGFIFVTVMVILLGLLVYWTLSVLLRAGLKANTWSYHDLMRKCYGSVGTYTYACFAFLFAYGGMCAYTVIIGDTVPIVMRAILGIADSNAELSMTAKILTDRRVVIILASFLIMLPISSFRDISKLAKFSITALAAVVTIAVSVIIAGAAMTKEQRFEGAVAVGNPLNLSINHQFFSIFNSEGIAGTIGTLCFAYTCHHNTFIIFRSLKKPSLNNFSKVNIFSLGFAMVASLVVGISGYALFNGLFTGSNVLNVFSNTNVLINFARALFAYDMFLTYPLELFIARNTILKVFCGEAKTVSFMIHAATTVALIATTTLIGTMTCNLGAVFDLTGGFAASAIAFIFPSACTIKLNNGPVLSRANLPHILCVSFGIFVLVYTTQHTLIEAITSDSHPSCKFVNF